jgi:hypothetical protein
VLDCFAHFPLKFIEVAQFAHSGAFSGSASLTVLRSLVIEEECLINLAKMSANIAFHLVSLDTRTVLSQNGVTNRVAAIRIAQFILDLC